MKTIRVSEDFHELLAAYNRDEETMEETLRRIVGGPDPAILADFIGEDEETAERLRAAIERRRERGRKRRADLRSEDR